MTESSPITRQPLLHHQALNIGFCIRIKTCNSGCEFSRNAKHLIPRDADYWRAYTVGRLRRDPVLSSGGGRMLQQNFQL